MKICGLQRLTLLDFPGRVACTVFLGGCNFRCPWCHNYDLAVGEAPEKLSREGLIDFLKERRGKLEGVAISGGEPCINDDLPDLLREIKALGYPVKLDTNGSRYGMLKLLISKGLVDYIAMDIKNALNLYPKTIGIDDFKVNIFRSSRMLLGSAIPHEFRTTVVDELHEPAVFHAIGKLIAGDSHYYLQPFKDSQSVPYSGFSTPSEEKMNECLKVAKQYLPNAAIRWT